MLVVAISTSPSIDSWLGVVVGDPYSRNADSCGPDEFDCAIFEHEYDSGSYVVGIN